MFIEIPAFPSVFALGASKNAIHYAVVGIHIQDPLFKVTRTESDYARYQTGF